MGVMDNKFLKLISLQSLQNWSVQYLMQSRFSYKEKFDLVPIGSFLKRSRQLISIEDDQLYQRVTVKINNGGVVPRDTVIGSSIGTKSQYRVKSGHFIMSKIDARNGAFGLVPACLHGAIVTNDFPVFDVDKSVILPEFLVLITTTKAFISFAQSCSSGTTNRQRIDIDAFLDVKIPLPSLPEQNRIVNAYNEKIKLAEELEVIANSIEQEIEDALLEELGLEDIVENHFTKCNLNLFQFSKMVDRWDVYNKSSNLLILLRGAKFPLKALSEVFNFVRRSWKKNKHAEEYFDYIDLGSIDTLKGITESRKIILKDAPSRATQTVKTGDLIIGTTRPYLKRFALVTEDYDQFIVSSGFQVIEPSKECNLEFLLEFLKSSYGTKQLEQHMTGALYPAITGRALKNILIPFPPVDIQNKIVKKSNKMKMRLIELNQRMSELYKIALKEFENEIFTR